MDYPMRGVQQHQGFRAVHPWQWWQWQLSVLASSSSPPAPSTRPPNHVSWDETGAAHIYSADLPGVRKEEIRVEIEDGRYLVIRTELDAGDAEVHGRRGSFARKFRLPGMVDADGITAEYGHGVGISYMAPVAPVTGVGANGRTPRLLPSMRHGPAHLTFFFFC
ncbi:hypothetical protein CFC21_023049 [Triticum aestivum]|uniref:SHSP domain-containing protein n=3 Tax=Triticum TaxID=4564 RepID=A0A9R1PKS1_TRITD|nr:18.8 kDa class V heat shock protein-like [Triticum aestivum]KAF7008241.1 hypothetical protein CFC21_023049 [Triticum aestivum]VAH45308.1 unnamed protein product [Triticum turgidum subsp. durum]